jgi:hypothetical protein
VADDQVPPVLATSASPEDPNLDTGPQAEALDELSEKLAAFNALRKSDEAAADAILDSLGGNGKVEQEIVKQLAVPRVLYLPHRFDQAHRLAMKSLEVLKRNGARGPKLPRNLGPLGPVAAWVVQLVTRFIVQSHITRVVDNVRHLYARREAWALPGSDEMVMLKRARMQADRVAVGYKGKALALPTFLLGGAFLTSAIGGLRALAQTALENRFLVVLLTVVLLGLLLGAAWCVLRAAAVARKRIRLTTQAPLRALYDTVGACGDPPKDDALKIALFGLVGMAVAWVVLPVGLVLVFA